VKWGLASSADIAAAADAARRHGRIGIDTEFISEGRYRALLCLVQIAVDDPQAAGGVRIILIDALADPDVASLAEVLADPAVELVVHAGRQDVALLRREWRTEVKNIFDTQIAAGFAGGGAQTGYANLLGTVLGQRVSKSASYTRWDARPLTDEQLSYAAEDVVHLLALAQELQSRLAASDRLQWAREECLRIEGATDERDPERAWERLPRVSGLDPRARAVARELAAWRERTAANEDRPVASVLSDVALVEIAKRRPASVRGLGEIRGVHPSTLRRRGHSIREAVAAGLQAAPIARQRAGERSDPADAPLIVLAEALLRARALEAGLAYELIASRGELETIVAAARRGEPEPALRTLAGWRHELVGADLRDLLAGRSAVSVGDGRRVAVTRTPPPAR